MKNTATTKDDSANRHRRIGKKVLLADRLARALNPTSHVPAKRSLSLPPLNRKLLTISFIAVALVGTLGFGGSQFYLAKATAAQEAAAAKMQAAQQIKSRAADACRREKVRQKADLIGKVTYDELYDYDECDK
jgi:hypothetical protein